MVFINAKIVKKFDEIVEKGFVRVKNGLIDEIGFMDEFVEVTEEVIDCEGLKIVPGFVDAHCHVGIWENGLNFEGADGNEETDPVCSHLRAIDGINPADDGFFDAVKAGITTVVVCPGSANPVGGDCVAMDTFGNCVDEMVVKQPIGIKFALGENPKSVYNEKGQNPTTRMAVAALIRETLIKAQHYLKRVQFAKNDISIMPEFDFKLEVLKPLLERKMKAFFHCHRADDICTAIRIANEFNLDFVLIHATEGYLIKNLLKGVNLIAGPLICDRLKPELKNHSVEGFAELVKNGCSVAFCSDHPVVPVNYLLHSCSVLLKYGLSKMDVLKLLTQKPAEICGIFDKVGSIEKFKFANFSAFKLQDDIFSASSEPEFVLINGKIVFKK